MTMRMTVLGVAMAAACLPAGTVSAQSAHAGTPTPAAARDVMLLEVPSLTDAARIYRTTADHQTAAGAARSYVRAGRLAYQAGALEAARRDLVHGARQALAADERVTAATAWTDAAWISLQLRQVERALDEMARARALVSDDAFPAADRRRLEGRLTSMVPQ